MEDKITTQMKKGVLEYIILAIIAKWEVYASDIITTLKDNNLILVEGTLYPPSLQTKDWRTLKLHLGRITSVTS